LLAAEGLENKAIADRTGNVENTVGKWRRRFMAAVKYYIVEMPTGGE
jgi:DNA-binding NarL/FixJ family response regulator